MKQYVEKFLQYGILTAITAVAVGVMWFVSSRSDSTARTKGAAVSLAPDEAQPRPLVLAERVTPALHEVTAKYSGKLRPWETFSLAFEQPGRIVELGQNEAGRPLDDGDLVKAGQLLARIDDRVLRARRAEAIATFEQRTTDLDRVRELRAQGDNFITAAEFQEYLTQLAMAKAAQEVADKNLEDALIASPVDATIARRMAEPGEMVGMNEMVFELVQIDELLLVIDVPESDIRELEERLRKVRENRAAGDITDPESLAFRARIIPEGRDRFGKRWPTIEAEVYRIAELADPRTGLFEVEVRVPNPGRLLRPGMVCTAELVVNRLSAYRIPETAVMFRSNGGKTDQFLFELEPQSREVRAMFWKVGEEPMQIARRVDLPVVIDQGRDLLVPSGGIELGEVVVRGQQRLSDGKLVRKTGETIEKATVAAGANGRDES